MASANFGPTGHPGGAVEFAASVPGGEIIASQAGSGAPVLILHGGPGLSDYTAPWAAELDDGFRVIRYQQRGVAPSTAAGPFGIDRHVTTDAIAVLDAAGAARAYVIGHSWGGHLTMHLAANHQDRLLGLVLADPLGAVPDGGESDLERILNERTPPHLAARAEELDEHAMASEGSAEQALESLAIVWPGYFSSPDKAPPMPPPSLSVDCYAATFASIHWHFEHNTLQKALPAVTVPAVFEVPPEPWRTPYAASIVAEFS